MYLCNWCIFDYVKSGHRIGHEAYRLDEVSFAIKLGGNHSTKTLLQYGAALWRSTCLDTVRGVVKPTEACVTCERYLTRYRAHAANMQALANGQELPNLPIGVIVPYEQWEQGRKRRASPTVTPLADADCDDMNATDWAELHGVADQYDFAYNRWSCLPCERTINLRSGRSDCSAANATLLTHSLWPYVYCLHSLSRSESYNKPLDLIWAGSVLVEKATWR